MDHAEGGQMTKEEARIKVDQAIRQLWIAFKDLSDFGVNSITDEDLDIWIAVTSHRAIQERLDRVKGGQND